MKNIIGNQPVSGDNFFGREKFIKSLLGLLLSNNSFLLLGLKRIGKSSTIEETIRQLKEINKDFEVISINCQTYRNIEDFYKNIYLALPKTWQQKLKDSLKDSKKLPTKIIDFISDHVEELDLPVIGSIKLRNDLINYSKPLNEEISAFFSKQDKQVILYIDELPFLFENIEKDNKENKIAEIETVLTTLRDWRNSGLSMIICGSLNLHLQLENLSISRKLLAGLNTQQLPNYTKVEAKGLLKALSESNKFELSDTQIDEALNIMPDYIPQFIQLYFMMMRMYLEDGNNLKDIYLEHVYPNIVTDFEYQFNERLAKFDKKDFTYIKKILNFISKKEVVHESEIVKHLKDNKTYSILLNLLSHEFLIKDMEENYRFSLNLLKNWWIKKNI
jgi:hypothetical protein